MSFHCLAIGKRPMCQAACTGGHAPRDTQDMSEVVTKPATVGYIQLGFFIDS
jgi:hypothetical protein